MNRNCSENSNYLMSNIPGKLVIAISELNQWAMDFEGNYDRICESILIAKSRGATYRFGPELEVTGYNCQDHFLEFDTIAHSYEVLARILSEKKFHGIVLDIGLPVMHDGVRYNARAICLDGDLVCIRPKTVLANDGVYHEERWFIAWKQHKLDEWLIPEILRRVLNKNTVPIGVFVLRFQDVTIGIEMCEELFVPNSIHNLLAMNGAHVICNGNGSHFRIGKINKRFSLVSDASGKTGCTYLYGNLQGCDGSTMYFDGGSFVASSGKIVSMCPRFSINSGCLVLTTIIDVNEIRSKRAAVVSLSKAAAECVHIPRINIPEFICRSRHERYFDYEELNPFEVINKNNKDVDELVGAPSCFIWDYLRRSGLSGFFVPLSGGADSSVVALLVYYMAHRVFDTISNSEQSESEKIQQILKDIIRDPSFVPQSPQDICKRILFTAYMASPQSSSLTESRAQRLADFINSNHISLNINEMCEASLKVVKTGLKFSPKFQVEGGSSTEDLALQNLQARQRMVLSYLFAQLIPVTQKNSLNSSLLVLGTANADEIVLGYFTKYDCSSADISPIAGYGKVHIKQLLSYFYDLYKEEVIYEIACATPSAELVPLSHGESVQTDEEEMGFTFEELAKLRELRSSLYCGPLSMFNILLDEWGKSGSSSLTESSITLEPEVIAEKVKRFFKLYTKNRHKTTILSPAVHLCGNGLDGRHYDMRPFLINILWKWQFRCIDYWLESWLNKNS